ncbi:MAG: AbrB/MazE/SpoVT family DNA-binding domain-containing protein [Desulfococcaceae bacterium]
METARINEDGGIKLPEKVRKALGLKTGDQVNFVVKGEKVALIRPSKSSISAVRGILQSNKVVTVEEMDASIQELHSKVSQ